MCCWPLTSFLLLLFQLCCPITQCNVQPAQPHCLLEKPQVMCKCQALCLLCPTSATEENWAAAEGTAKSLGGIGRQEFHRRGQQKPLSSGCCQQREGTHTCIHPLATVRPEGKIKQWYLFFSVNRKSWFRGRRGFSFFLAAGSKEDLCEHYQGKDFLSLCLGILAHFPLQCQMGWAGLNPTSFSRSLK